ncbi:MAG: hypothetical protein LZF86_110333 [Nitrospira sp.]|nr:MAG: hypothetical protein LZF86_110333 [Nitrospira sp.]
MAEHDLEKLLGGFAADTLTPEERQQLFTAAMQDQQLFDALADEQALKELLTDPSVRRRLLQALNSTTPAVAAKSVSWLDWLRQPAHLALAGGLATALFAVVLGTKVYQDSLKQAAPSAAAEEAKPASTPPAESQPTEPKTKEPDAPAPIAAKKERLTDKLASRERVAPSQQQDDRATDTATENASKRTRQEEDRKQTAAPLASSEHKKDALASVDRQPTVDSPVAAPEPNILRAPAGASLHETSASTVSARALFYGDAVRADAAGMLQTNERAMKPLGESAPQANASTRKLERLSPPSKAEGPVAPVKPLGLRYSLVTQNAEGQEQEIGATTAATRSTPMQLTLEANQDGYVQVWQHVGSTGTHLLLPQKDSGHISMKIRAGQRQRLPLPADSGTVIVRLSRVPFGPISRQEAALLDRFLPTQLQESGIFPSSAGSQEQATYVVSQDLSPTAQIAVDIQLAQR